MARLGDYVAIKTGKLDANAASSDGVYPFFTCAVEPLRIDTYSYDCECVLVAGNGDLNVKYYSGKFDAYQRTYIIESLNKEALTVPYLFCFLDKYVETLREQSIGGVIKYIKLGNLTEAQISVPIKCEQEEIVHKLGRVNAIISLRKQQLSKLGELVKSQFIEMFGDPVVNPMGWEVKPLSNIITHANNGMSRRGNDENGDIVLRLVELQDGYIDYSKPNRLILDKAEKARYSLSDGDFLFARVNGNPGNVGRCAVFKDIGEPVYHNDHIIRVRFNDQVMNGLFASELLNSSYGKGEMKDKIKTSAGQYTINQAGIGAIKAPLPPLELQNRFADFVRQADKSKFEIQKSLEKYETLKKALMQQYFG